MLNFFLDALPQAPSSLQGSHGFHFGAYQRQTPFTSGHEALGTLLNVRLHPFKVLNHFGLTAFGLGQLVSQRVLLIPRHRAGQYIAQVCINSKICVDLVRYLRQQLGLLRAFAMFKVTRRRIRDAVDVLLHDVLNLVPVLGIIESILLPDLLDVLSHPVDQNTRELTSSLHVAPNVLAARANLIHEVGQLFSLNQFLHETSPSHWKVVRPRRDIQGLALLFGHDVSPDSP